MVTLVVTGMNLHQAGPAFASGPTEVSGDLTSSTTWTLDRSPYIVTATVRVMPGVTLTVEPGVAVRFRVTYTWDGAGRAETVTDWAGRTYTYDNDANGNTTNIEFPTGSGNSDAFSYDHSGRTTANSTTHSGASISTVQYGRDLAGAVTSVTQGGLPGNNQNYAYDALDHLCYAAGSGSGTCDEPPTGATSYTYDSADNLTAGASAATQRFNTANQLCWTSQTAATGTCDTPPTGATTYSYDTRGNRTAQAPAAGNQTTYVYDQANHLTATTGAVTSTYTYDGDGLRTGSTIEGATSTFTWSHAGALPLILNDGTNAYVYGPDGLPLAHQEIATGEVAYYHHDQLGSTRLLTGTDGTTIGAATYDPHGTLAASSGQISPLGFAGQYTDPHTGLQYLRARYYDPTNGQFLTRDPLESVTGEAYVYGSNDPINNTDPTGLCPWCVSAIVGAGAGYLAGSLRGASAIANAANKVDDLPTVNWGQQSKHFPGHPNYISGRSKLTANPETLIQGAGSGTPVGKVPRGQPGFKERIDFGDDIGTYVARDGTSRPTSIGVLHYRADGSVHIIPGRPR